MQYLLHIAIMLNIYIMLVLSANLTIGLANLLTMCQAAFYGIGAYIGTLFLTEFNLPFVAIIAIVSLVTGLFSFVVSYASVKLKGDYFVLATMGFQLIVYTILYNWKSVTRGSNGIDVPDIKILGIWEISGIYSYLALSIVLAAAVILLFVSLHDSPYGRELRAIKADELSVQSMGRDTATAKSWAFFISAAVAGVAGVLYASFMGYIHPNSFTLNESIFIISALFIGGIGNVKGPVFGALFVVLLPELLRFVGLPAAQAANLRQIIYGLALILVVYFRPRGLFGETDLK
jgi:branched-chain amino acid transport system permease protein